VTTDEVEVKGVVKILQASKQQAALILSEITRAMEPGQESAGAKVPADAGNSFGGAPMEQVHFQQSLPHGRGA